jgi:hypothetical protein
MMLGGCDDATAVAPRVSPVRIEPTSALYAPADSVYYRISNLTDQTLMYSDCFARLEYLGATSWREVPVTEPNCATSLTFLPAGQSARVLGKVLPADVADGTYRLVVGAIEGRDEAIIVRPEDFISAAFRVEQ